MKIIKKKIIIGFTLFILVGSIVLLLNRTLIFVKESNFLERNLNNAEILKNKNEETINEKLDTDNDGLADNLEKDIGTNFEKNDTDGDGYGDFEEIKNGYSPVVASPRGKLLQEEFIALKEKVKNSDPVFYEKIFAEKDIFVVSDSSGELVDSLLAMSLSAPIELSGPAVFKKEVSLSNKNWKYSFYAPADIDMNKEHTLIVGLHSFEGKAADYIRFWQSDADKNGFLVAILQAYPKTYPSGATIESYPWLEISDFTKAVLDNVGKKYKIDEDKIFLTGYSAGAVASYIIALDSGIKFRGVILIDGYLPLEAGIIDKLSKAKDVNFYVVHGADDIDAEAVISQEKLLLQYGAKMEFKILSNVEYQYPASEHESILEWTRGLIVVD